MHSLDMEQSIYSMKLGDMIKGWGGVWDIWRVPGGWLFAVDIGRSVSSTFVPFNNDFMRPSDLRIDK